uniref:Protein phosphatase n=1 Tax=Chlamydomonas euryale TaxID=1486919 RepID=A0A7R9VA27_9CHLO|mmetsp:Transcript_24389/g.72328  ORF Transcript_24389/g.72328 Transcript_24389/m.72328 type:complete len:399 (+) Transcript_24389:260-1456(+)
MLKGLKRISGKNAPAKEAGNDDARFAPLKQLGENEQLVWIMATRYLPHPDKVSYGGEDAHFISNYGGGAIGVADGVGGWQEAGVNPAEYSRTLIANARAYIEGTLTEFTEDELEARIEGGDIFIDPKGALHAAHIRTKVPGSATAVVMQLSQDTQSLVAANVGDSGFVVIRAGRIVARSRALQHYFDCPLQFGSFPDFVEATDTAEDADVYNERMYPGDVLVAGTDGLWDNVYDHEIISIVLRHRGAAPQPIADDIAALARNHASDADFYSPYIREAQSQGLDLPWWEKLLGAGFRKGKFGLRQLSGGKQDDITVVVAVVATQERPPQMPPVAAAAAAAETIAEASLKTISRRSQRIAEAALEEAAAQSQSHLLAWPISQRMEEAPLEEAAAQPPKVL